MASTSNRFFPWRAISRLDPVRCWHGGSVNRTTRRTKVCDCFKEMYKWKNRGNRPAEEPMATNNASDDLQERLTLETVHHLERLSLVDFSNEAAIARLSSAIRFADRLKDIDTTGVKPLYSLMENETLRLREDEVTEGNQKADVLRNATITFEDFFVAPPGNIPLEQRHSYPGLDKSFSEAAREESSVDLKKAKRKAKF